MGTTISDLLSDPHVARLVDGLSTQDSDAAQHMPPRGDSSQVGPLRGQWPSLDHRALHDLAGDFVRAIEPHSEADPAALLIQFHVAFGNVIGRGPHFVAEADLHYTNLYAVLVGATASGRKGTSWSHIRRRFASVDEAWAQSRIQTGLSSGEGLIWAVRDPVEAQESVKEGGRVVDYQTVVTDPGVSDKRLLVVEPEFASTLRRMTQQASTLSAVVRSAWDCGDLATLTKNATNRAHGAHISIIGHITRDEFVRDLSSIDAANGYMNRHLLVCVKRSKALPNGGNLASVDMGPLVRRLDAAIAFARTVGELRRDTQADAVWDAIYADLSEGKPGLLGAIIARAEAQVMRLACVYALESQSAEVRVEHLCAALALWQYCEASARWVFEDRLGDPLADEILDAIRTAGEKGLTRTQLSEAFSKNQRANRMHDALRQLVEAGLIHPLRDTETGGAPRTTYLPGKGE